MNHLRPSNNIDNGIQINLCENLKNHKRLSTVNNRWNFPYRAWFKKPCAYWAPIIHHFIVTICLIMCDGPFWSCAKDCLILVCNWDFTTCIAVEKNKPDRRIASWSMLITHYNLSQRELQQRKLSRNIRLLHDSASSGHYPIASSTCCPYLSGPLLKIFVPLNRPSSGHYPIALSRFFLINITLCSMLMSKLAPFNSYCQM
jgi:hypothetical protein